MRHCGWYGHSRTAALDVYGHRIWDQADGLDLQWVTVRLRRLRMLEAARD